MKTCYCFFFLILIISCGQKREVQHATTNIYLPKIVDANSKTIMGNLMFKKAHLEVDSIVKGLNLRYPNVVLEIQKQSNDTLYTFIKDSYYLGERMGNTGVEDYFANAIVNITQLGTIRFVNFALEDGSHVAPGVWGIDDYKNYKLKP
ncbi:MAG: hypothetical protein QM541_03830 [Flavobacterium sp.]|nr:hypothetical protein [Flavobacterium sp.]